MGVLNINTYSCGNHGHVIISNIGRDNDRGVVFIFSTCKGQYSNNMMGAPIILFTNERGHFLRWKKIICNFDLEALVDMMTKKRFEVVKWQLALVAK